MVCYWISHRGSGFWIMANKNKRCCHCKEYFEESTMQKLPVGWFCSQDHILQYAINKSTKATKTKERIQYREDKERIKTYSQIAAEAEASVRRYIRARDKGKPCISCGTTNDVQYAAGHYKTAGGHPELRFNVLNQHLQCNKHCNKELSGNIHGTKHSDGYRVGLINRHGQWIVDYLESHHPAKGYTKEDLQRIKKIFNRRARFYEKRNN